MTAIAEQPQVTDDELYDVLYESKTALVVSMSATNVIFYTVHVSDDASSEEYDAALAYLPDGAECSEVLSMDSDPVLFDGPGWMLTYWEAVPRQLS